MKRKRARGDEAPASDSGHSSTEAKFVVAQLSGSVSFNGRPVPTPSRARGTKPMPQSGVSCRPHVGAGAFERARLPKDTEAFNRHGVVLALHAEPELFQIPSPFRICNWSLMWKRGFRHHALYGCSPVDTSGFPCNQSESVYSEDPAEILQEIMSFCAMEVTQCKGPAFDEICRAACRLLMSPAANASMPTPPRDHVPCA